MEQSESTLYDFFRSNYGLVAHVARRFAPHPELIPDIVQQVYLVFLKDAEQKNWALDGESKPLLYQVTKNVARQFWRKHRQESSESLRKIGELLVRHDAGSVSPIEELETNDEIVALRGCLEKLTPNHRRLVDLKYYLGTPTREIAIMFEVKQNSVMRALARIRTILADCITTSLRRD